MACREIYLLANQLLGYRAGGSGSRKKKKKAVGWQATHICHFYLLRIKTVSKELSKVKSKNVMPTQRINGNCWIWLQSQGYVLVLLLNSQLTVESTACGHNQLSVESTLFGLILSIAFYCLSFSQMFLLRLWIDRTKLKILVNRSLVLPSTFLKK